MTPLFSDRRSHIDRLVRAATAAADPAQAVRRHARREGMDLHVAGHQFDLLRGRVFLVGIGKAAVPMTVAMSEIITGSIHAAAIVTKRTERDWSRELAASPLGSPRRSLQLVRAGHPVSDDESVRAAAIVREMLFDTTYNDLVICLISGGASALFTRPLMPLADWRMLNELLLASGCSIGELNCVRRRLDEVKGGGLARIAAPAACVSLIVSDVVGNALEAIGSGPTVITSEKPDAALSILTRYGLDHRLPADVWSRISAALAEERELPPAPAVLANHVICDVGAAAQASMLEASRIGFISQVVTTHLEGEAREVGRVVAAVARDLPPGRCLVWGGETTVTVRGRGLGGRNQELALAAALALEGSPNRIVASFATDGEDGPTSAAGAIVSGETAQKARSLGLDPGAYLGENDSFHFFASLDEKLQPAAGQRASRQVGTAPIGHHLLTGPTGTNVNDLLFLIAYPGN